MNNAGSLPPISEPPKPPPLNIPGSPKKGVPITRSLSEGEKSAYQPNATFVKNSLQRVKSTASPKHEASSEEISQLNSPSNTSKHSYSYSSSNSGTFIYSAATTPTTESPPPDMEELVKTDVMTVGKLNEIEAVLQSRAVSSPTSATKSKVERYISAEGKKYLAKLKPETPVYITPKGKIFVETSLLGQGSFQKTAMVTLVGHLKLQELNLDQLQFKALSMPKKADLTAQSVDKNEAAELEAARIESPNVIEMHKHLKALRTTKGPNGEKLYTGSLSHVCGANIISHSPTGGSAVFTEFCNGGTIDRHLQARQAKPGNAAERQKESYFLAAEMCKGVGQFHAAGLVHRDLKPDNFYMKIAPNGQIEKVMLGDFSKGAYSAAFIPGGKGYVPTYIVHKYYSSQDKINLADHAKISGWHQSAANTEGRIQQLKEDIDKATEKIAELRKTGNETQVAKEEGALKELQNRQGLLKVMLGELHQHTERFYQTSSDVYQLGITLYEVLCDIPTGQLDISKTPWPKFDTLDKDVQEMLISMWNPDPSKRPSAATVEQFFRSKLS